MSSEFIKKHKKGEYAGDRYIEFAGYIPSTWAEDGWHDTRTMRAVPAPTKEKKDESPV